MGGESEQKAKGRRKRRTLVGLGAVDDARSVGQSGGERVARRRVKDGVIGREWRSKRERREEVKRERGAGWRGEMEREWR